jgi:chaperonin GroES
MINLLHDNIALVPTPLPEKVGLLWMPQIVSPKSAIRCEVVATGPGKRTRKGAVIPVEVSVGDIVYIPKFSGNPVTIDNVNYYFVTVNDILGVEEVPLD